MESLLFNYTDTCLEVQLEVSVLANGFKYKWTGSLISFDFWLKLCEPARVDILKVSHAYLFKKRSRESK